MNKALFLDRDGVINVDKGYVYRIEDFFFTENIFNIARHFQEKEFLIIVVTNQSGIARGYYKESEFFKLTDWMLQEFQSKGINITKVYHCPHHPDFSGGCNCRKPSPGMILEACKEFNLDRKESILIGDNNTDIEAGIAAEIGTNLFIQEFSLDNYK